ncbi:hypothetical protein [Curtobacterium sp. ZW137]|uniref:hypothetical protein n=1 Tax=Curtobacterium sp. ZW137 TaxID=2485104 RepID=UPI000F4C05B6|nr:hypothetical protein [Curtobacterium sp. ZW137]ROP65679.1 hypothetical protein EDF55_0118 [Curtobacterium sp. ZW137]
MHRSTSGVRRACAVGTTIALIGLTTGLGVFSATAAYAVDPGSASSVSADPTDADGGAAGTGDGAPTTDQTTDGQPDSGAGADAGAGAGAGADQTNPGSDQTAGDSSDQGTDGSDAGNTAGNTGTGDADTSTDGTTGSGTGTTGTTNPSDTDPSDTDGGDTTAVAPAPVAATIKGDAKVGTVLEASADELDGPYAYAWSLDGGPVVSTKTSYTITKADIGKTITVVITGADDATATATTAAVTQDVAYDGATSYDAPRTIEVTAGDTIEESFAVAEGSGDVTYSIGYSDPESADPSDPDDSPESYLPYESVFDTTTGTLSGTLTTASAYDFTVVASNGTSTATEYVEVVVDPAAAVGVLAQAINTSPEDLFENGKPATAWIINWTGEVVQIDIPADIENDDVTITPGGKPTVKQGGSLWVDGSPVDQYGNQTTDWDGEGEYPMATVTSDHATDQVSVDEDTFTSKVTFPHASTHVLTVAEDGQSVSFAVTVVPTATTTVATVTPTATSGGQTQQLAYTGSDATGALPWALAMLAAGAGLVGLRAVRRRAQR